jgi:predicted dehydrogenase
MDKVRVGVIGCGAFAGHEHFPNCVRNPNVEITWACSRTPEKREAAQRDFGAKRITADAAEVFAADDVDMVILSIPHALHVEMVEAAAAAGKHIFCEKPMAMNTDESYRIVRAVRRGGVKLCVDYNRRFSPAMQDLRDRYHAHRANPAITPWKFVDTQREVLPEEEQTMLLIRIQDESSTYRPIHIDYKTGGGEIIGETCHWLDLACYLLNDEPVRITGHGSSRLSHVLHLEFSQGHQCCIFFGVTGTFDYPKELYELMDHGALFRSECFVENQVFGQEQPVCTTFPLQFDECPEVGAEGGLSGYVAKHRKRAEHYAATGKQTYLNIAPDKGHYQLLCAYVDAIANDKPAPIDEMAGARATYLSLRAIESIRLGTALPINKEDFEFFVW